ncbi:MAG: DNA (cytosine-5-)-methyltransferase [Anaerolineales bacterium]|nr:MAG: DNA (cytosine-5-)-methyltransferase [Anaerolineales bacterium]
MFAGVGGMTHGFLLEGFPVVAGFDSDENCKYPYEANNPGSRFNLKKIEETTPNEILNLFPENHNKIFVGCAPCQPYSSYTKKKNSPGEKWKLIDLFGDLICSIKPEVVSMENVPDLVRYEKGRVYDAFVTKLKQVGYYISEYPEVFCPQYGIPQIRTRLIFFASKFGKVNLEDPQYPSDKYKTVRDTIYHLEHIEAGEISKVDPIHRSSRLSEINLRRIRSSYPGGTWRDWREDLIAACHKKASGASYRSVYGRMSWDQPSPTITTECHGYGNGRFGHPEQNRAISLREAALLQTFPADYKFVEPGKPVYFDAVARLIGNAVPVDLGRVIARSIRRHLEKYDG